VYEQACIAACDPTEPVLGAIGMALQLLILPFTGILNQQSIAAVSQAAQKAMRQTSHEWCLHL
jgi:hypothetical protein